MYRAFDHQNSRLLSQASEQEVAPSDDAPNHEQNVRNICFNRSTEEFHTALPTNDDEDVRTVLLDRSTENVLLTFEGYPTGRATPIETQGWPSPAETRNFQPLCGLPVPRTTGRLIISGDALTEPSFSPHGLASSHVLINEDLYHLIRPILDRQRRMRRITLSDVSRQVVSRQNRRARRTRR